MSIKLNGTMDGKSWEESPLDVPADLAENAPKLTRVKTERDFKGELEGSGTVGYYQMIYHPDAGADAHHGSAQFSSLQYFTGSIKGAGKSTITFIGTGYYGPETGAVCEWVSDPQSGTGDLAGLKVKGGYVAKGMKDVPITLEIQK